MIINCHFMSMPGIPILMPEVPGIWVAGPMAVGCYHEVVINTGDEVTLVGVGLNGVWLQLSDGSWFGETDPDNVAPVL